MEPILDHLVTKFLNEFDIAGNAEIFFPDYQDTKRSLQITLSVRYYS